VLSGESKQHLDCEAWWVFTFRKLKHQISCLCSSLSHLFMRLWIGRFMIIKVDRSTMKTELYFVQQ
jgi:hypothetical protein